MTKEEKIAEIEAKADAIMAEYAEEYEALAKRSDRLYDEQEALLKAYEALDAKTGLNALYEQMAALHEEEVLE